MDNALTAAQASQIVKPFGFKARQVPLGYFLNQGGDDLVLVRRDGQIDPYAHDANAFFVASVLSRAIRATA
jgi:hypothetical protein